LFKKLLLLTWLELKVYLRDPAAIFWTFFFPFLLLVIFMAVNSEDEETFVSTKVIIVEGSDDKLSRQYIHDIETVFKYISLPIKSERVKGPWITDKLSNDQLVIQLPEHFERDFKAAQGANIVIAHAVKPNDSTSAVLSVIESLNDKFNIKHNGWKLTSRIEFAPAATTSDAQTLTVAQYLTTGLIGMTILSTCLFGFSVVIVQLRAANAFKIYQVLPITPLWYFSAFIVSRLIVMIAFSLVFVIVADLMYTLDFDYSPSNLLNFMLLVAMGAITFMSIGILLASRTSSASTAMGITNMIYFPLIFLSGLFFPISSTLEWINVLSAYLPLKEYVEMFRAIIFAGGSYADYIGVLVLMLVWSAVTLAIAHKVFVWNNKR
jgi:ABC-2 type transport system permease protein